MPAFTVTLDVDGEIVVETVIGAIDAQEAIKKAMKRHPTLVLGASPLEIQMELEDVHPGQSALEVDPETGEVVPDGETYPYVDPEDVASDQPEDVPTPGSASDPESLDPLTDQPEEPEGGSEHDFPEITPDGPFEEAAANPFGESAPDPVHAEAVLAEMRGSDPDGLDS